MYRICLSPLAYLGIQVMPELLATEIRLFKPAIRQIEHQPMDVVERRRVVERVLAEFAGPPEQRHRLNIGYSKWLLGRRPLNTSRTCSSVSSRLFPLSRNRCMAARKRFGKCSAKQAQMKRNISAPWKCGDTLMSI